LKGSFSVRCNLKDTSCFSKDYWPAFEPTTIISKEIKGFWFYLERLSGDFYSRRLGGYLNELAFLFKKDIALRCLRFCIK